jgi:hypothetical protein
MTHKRLSQNLCLLLVSIGFAFVTMSCTLIRVPPLHELNTALIDQGDFSTFQDVALLDLDQVKPARSYVYWEWIAVMDTTPRTMAAGGQMARTELSRTAQAALDNFSLWQASTEGFGHDCLPALCWQYVAVVDGEQIQQWTRPSEIKTFLGAIDTLADAVLLMEAASVIRVELIKPAASGYSVVVTRDDTGDDPKCELISLNIYRELLRITHTGQISVVARKLTDRFCGVF